MQTTIAKYRDDPDLQNLIDFSQQFVSLEKFFWSNLRLNFMVYLNFSWNVVEEQMGHKIGKIMFISIVRQKLLSMK